jgi:hypothetical protein
VTVDGTPLGERDGAAITGEERIAIAADAPAEILLADLP